MIAIIKYNAGNIGSVGNAVDRLGVPYVVSSNADEIRSADKVLFPGVGEASTAMRFLKEQGLDTLIPTLKQPVLGICLGMQLMCKSSEEGPTEGMSIFDTEVKAFPAEGIVPHMGWNELTECSGPLFNGLSNESDVYFVHSYFADLCEQTSAQCDYIVPFSAALEKDNFYGTQFHPEKSSKNGQLILQNFVSL